MTRRAEAGGGLGGPGPFTAPPRLNYGSQA